MTLHLFRVDPKFSILDVVYGGSSLRHLLFLQLIFAALIVWPVDKAHSATWSFEYHLTFTGIDMVNVTGVRRDNGVSETLPNGYVPVGETKGFSLLGSDSIEFGTPYYGRTDLEFDGSVLTSTCSGLLEGLCGSPESDIFNSFGVELSSGEPVISWSKNLSGFSLFDLSFGLFSGNGSGEYGDNDFFDTIFISDANYKDIAGEIADRLFLNFDVSGARFVDSTPPAPTPIPLPASLPLMAAGAGILFLLRKRGKSRRTDTNTVCST